MTIPKNRLTIIFFAIPLLLFIPFIAMNYTDQVNWSILDFLVMGVLLLMLGLGIELLLQLVKKKTHRILAVALALIIFLLIWAELAVGIFGTPFAGS